MDVAEILGRAPGTVTMFTHKPSANLNHGKDFDTKIDLGGSQFSGQDANVPAGPVFGSDFHDVTSGSDSSR